MKRTILTSIIGLAISLAAKSTHAQGAVILFENYGGNGYQTVNYGTGIPGAVSGTPIQNGLPSGINWTIGLYYAEGPISVASDPTGIADPSALGPALMQVQGLSATIIPGSPGYFNGGDWGDPGYEGAGITFMVVAYSGTSYDDSQYRGHSTGFYENNFSPLQPAQFISMQSFDVYAVPEPSGFALCGIGAAIMFARRTSKRTPPAAPKR